MVLIGAECTGKTVLAGLLAHRLGAPFVPEASRLFVERVGRAVVRGDEEAIVALHLAWAEAAELRARQEGASVVVYDTDLLSTVLYARHYQGSCPSRIVRMAAERRADLYLVTDTDVPWIDEPGQRGTPADRDAVHRLVLAAVRRRSIPWVLVSGPTAKRIETALAAVRHFVD